MIVKYVDFGGDPQECTGVQFQELYLAGKVPPEQTVLANGEPMDVMKLLGIIDDAQDAALLKAVRKAKLEEEKIKKTAPWWLKRNARWLITLGIVALGIGAPWLLYDFLPRSVYQGTTGQNFVVRIFFFLLWLFYYHVGGAKRYNNIADLYRMDEHDDIIREIERKQKRRRRNADDQDGGKNNG